MNMRGSQGIILRAILPDRQYSHVRHITKPATSSANAWRKTRYLSLGHVAAQVQQLPVERNLHRTDVRARPAQAAGVGECMIRLGVLSRVEHRANRPGYRGMIAVPATAPVDRTGVQTSPAPEYTQSASRYSALARRLQRPLSTRTTCNSPPGAGPWKCDV